MCFGRGCIAAECVLCSKMTTRHQGNELQRLSNRMDDMAAKFTAELNSFRKDLLTKPSMSSESTGELQSITDRFSTFEANINECLQNLRREIDELKSRSEQSAMTSNSKSIMLHGLQETQQGDLYENVISVITTYIEPNFCKNDINFFYRLGPKKPDSTKSRPIVVSFCRRWMRDHIYYRKKHLKGTKILLTELLTPANLKLFKDARKIFTNSCWTTAGRVFVFHNGVKVSVGSPDLLAKITNQSNSE